MKKEKVTVTNLCIANRKDDIGRYSVKAVANGTPVQIYYHYHPTNARARQDIVCRYREYQTMI